MADTMSLNNLLNLARQVQAEFTASPFPDCQSLHRRAHRLEQRLTAPAAARSESRLLWLDDVLAALDSALAAAARLEACKDLPLHPPGLRAKLARLCGRRPRSPRTRELEAIRAASGVIHEWLAAFAALQAGGSALPAVDDDACSAISLGDSAPHLPVQFVPVHRDARLAAKKAVLTARGRTDSVAPAAVFVLGPRGVGKSTLASALARDPDLAGLFSVAPGWVQLGVDAGEEDVCDELVGLVSSVAGEGLAGAVQEQRSLDAIVERVEGLFADAPLLVVLDDPCGRAGRDALRALASMLGPGSVVLVTAAAAADVTGLVDALPQSAEAVHVELSPLAPAGEEASVLFDSWLHSQPKQSRNAQKREEEFRPPILTACAGLPLALAMAAGSVSHSSDAWARVAGALSVDGDEEPVDAAERLARPVGRLLTELLERGGEHFVEQMRALAVLPRGQWVSLKTLANLWGVSDNSVKASARRIANLCFGEYRLSDSSEQSAVRLCWYVSEYCLQLLSPRELAAGHRTLLDRCAERGADAPRSAGSAVAWWDITRKDAYLRRRLCWHMACAGAADELRSLLCEYSWMVARLEPSVYGLRLDIDLCMALGRGGSEQDMGKVAFGAVEGALEDLSMSARGRTAGRANLAPVLAARLQTVAGADEMSGRILKSVYRDAPRPWLKPMYSVRCEAYKRRRRRPGPTGDPPSSVGDVEGSGVNEGSTEMFTEAEVVEDEPADYPLDHADGTPNAIVSTASNSLGHAISAESAGRILVWDVKSGDRISEFDAADPSDAASTLDVLATLGNDTVVSGHSTSLLRLWSVSRSSLQHDLRGHAENDAITALATYEPSTVVSGTASGEILLWLNVFADEPSTARIRRLGGETDAITALCVLPGGSRVVSGSYDGFAAVWDVTRPAGERVSLNGHRHHVTMFAPLLNGKRLASACKEGSVNIWDTTTGSRLFSLSLGMEFGSPRALAAFAGGNFRSRKQPDEPLGARVGFPYFVTRGEFEGEVVVVTAVGQNEIVGSSAFPAEVGGWEEVWHPASSGVYVVVACGGEIAVSELVTALLGCGARNAAGMHAF